MTDRNDMTLPELAQKSGVSPRTIRYYIARNLLPGPGKAGRGASYGAAHLDQLRKIQELQRKGRTLVEIARLLADDVSQRAAEATVPTAWWNYRIADDVVAYVRADASPWRLRQVRNALAELAARIGTTESKENPS